MNIYLIRHGEAEPTSNDKPHEKRELTAEGIEILKASVETWKKFLDTFNIILSSPLKRAKQTASIIKQIFNVQTDVMEVISLANGGVTEDLLNLAESLDLEDIAMVGHQPDISSHISRLVGTSEFNSRVQPATIIKISFNSNPRMGRGKLEFFIPPVNKKG